MDQITQPLIGPQPLYPTPWRLAEFTIDGRLVEDANGHWVFKAPDSSLAELIVDMVNKEAEGLAS